MAGSGGGDAACLCAMGKKPVGRNMNEHTREEEKQILKKEE